MYTTCVATVYSANIADAHTQQHALYMIWLFTAETSNVVEPECVVLFLMYDMILTCFPLSIWHFLMYDMALYRRVSECCLSEFDSCLCFPFWIWLFPKYDTTCYRRDLECCRVEMCPCLPLRICLVPMCDMAVCVCVVIWLFAAHLQCRLDNIWEKPFPIFDMTLYLYDMIFHRRDLECCRAYMCCNYVYYVCCNCV